MSSMDQTEVMVSGAGPVGMLTALLLAKNGIKTRIIDQESRTTGHSYCCALHPKSIELLQHAGIAEDALDFGRRVSTVAFYEGNERRAEVKFSDLPVAYPFALVMEQSVLENLLEQKLRQEKIRVSWDHRLSNVEMDDQGVAATIEGLCMTGKGYGVPDFDMEVENVRQTRAQFVVGADGVNSLVRAKLNILLERMGNPQHFEVFEIETAGICGDEVVVVMDDTTTSVLWPLTDTRCRWSFQVNPVEEGDDFPQKERDRVVIVEAPGRERHLHRLQRLLKARAPWFKIPFKEVVWSTEVQFEPRLARHFGRRSCWLAGDAAHQTSPVGMQSMNMGFREAADLANVLTDIIRNGAPAELLKGYDRAHWAEWLHLLGAKPGAVPVENASEWVRRRTGRVISSIPASGPELRSLLGQVGITFQ